jgi:hypothetical protein
MSTITEVTTFVIQTCCHSGCGLQFGMEASFDRMRRNDHKWWYCPNGHQQHYSGKSEAEKLAAEKKILEDRLGWAQTARQAALDQAAATERSNRALKGVVTKTKKRVASGVCPVPGCKRHFADLQRHVNTKHPDYPTAQEH